MNISEIFKFVDMQYENSKPLPKSFINSISKTYSVVSSEISVSSKSSFGIIIDRINKELKMDYTINTFLLRENFFPTTWEINGSSVYTRYKDSVLENESLICAWNKSDEYAILEAQIKMFCTGMLYCELIKDNKPEKIRFSFDIILTCLKIIQKCETWKPDVLKCELMKRIGDYLEILQIKKDF
jgi:hypothetical protein